MCLICFTAECGMAGPTDNRIVGPGSSEATPHEYPWQVALFFTEGGSGGRYFCGGSLISKTDKNQNVIYPNI